MGVPWYMDWSTWIACGRRYFQKDWSAFGAAGYHSEKNNMKLGSQVGYKFIVKSINDPTQKKCWERGNKCTQKSIVIMWGCQHPNQWSTVYAQIVRIDRHLQSQLSSYHSTSHPLCSLVSTLALHSTIAILSVANFCVTTEKRVEILICIDFTQKTSLLVLLIQEAISTYKTCPWTLA